MIDFYKVKVVMLLMAILIVISMIVLKMEQRVSGSDSILNKIINH